MENQEMVMVKKVLAGDRAAFDAFYETYFGKVYNYIFLQTGEAAASEMLTEEVLATILESLKCFNGRTSLLCRVYCVTRSVTQEQSLQK